MRAGVSVQSANKFPTVFGDENVRKTNTNYGKREQEERERTEYKSCIDMWNNSKCSSNATINKKT